MTKPAGTRPRHAGIVDQRARIVGREWTPDRGPGRITAADNRLAPIVGCSRTAAYPPPPTPAVIRSLRSSTTSALTAPGGRSPPTSERSSGNHIVTGWQSSSARSGWPWSMLDVLGDPDISVVMPHDALTARQLDPHSGHPPILRHRPTGSRKHLAAPPRAQSRAAARSRSGPCDHR
jgi:hypothetical protein